MSKLSGMTRDELLALPIGPFQYRERPLTDEEIASGKVGRTYREVVLPEVRVRVIDPDDPLCVMDRQGNVYIFGQWADGRYFRQLIAL